MSRGYRQKIARYADTSKVIATGVTAAASASTLVFATRQYFKNSKKIDETYGELSNEFERVGEKDKFSCDEARLYAMEIERTIAEINENPILTTVMRTKHLQPLSREHSQLLRKLREDLTNLEYLYYDSDSDYCTSRLKGTVDIMNDRYMRPEFGREQNAWENLRSYAERDNIFGTFDLGFLGAFFLVISTAHGIKAYKRVFSKRNV